MNRVGRCLSGLVGFLLLLGTAEAQSEEMVPLYQEGGAFTPCQEDTGFSSLEPLLQVRLVQFVPADHPEAPRPEGCRIVYSYNGAHWGFWDLPITSIRYLISPNRKHLLLVGEQAPPYPGTAIFHFNLTSINLKPQILHPYHHALKQYDLNFYTPSPAPGEDEARYFLPSSKPSLEIPEDPKNFYDDPENDGENIPYGDYDIELRISRWSRFPENRDDHFSLFFRLGKYIRFNPDPKLYEPLFQERVKRLGEAVANDYPYYLYGYLSGHFTLTEMVKALLAAPTREVAPELEVNCDTPGEQFTTRIEDKVAFLALLRRPVGPWSGYLKGNRVEMAGILPFEKKITQKSQDKTEIIPTRKADGTFTQCSEEDSFTLPGTSAQLGMYNFHYSNEDYSGPYYCKLGYSLDNKEIWYLRNAPSLFPVYIFTQNNDFLMTEEYIADNNYRLNLFSISDNTIKFIDSINDFNDKIASMEDAIILPRNTILKSNACDPVRDGSNCSPYISLLHIGWNAYDWDDNDFLPFYMTIGKEGIHFSQDPKIYEDEFLKRAKFSERISNNYYPYYFSGYLSKNFTLTEVARSLLEAPTTEESMEEDCSPSNGDISNKEPLIEVPNSNVDIKAYFLIVLSYLPYLDTALHEKSRESDFLKTHPKENDHGTNR